MYDPDSGSKEQSNEPTVETPQMDVSAHLTLEDQGHLLYSETCQTQLYTEYLIVTTQSEKCLKLFYREIISIDINAYQIEIESILLSKWVLNKLGYLFEDFYQKLLALRNEILLNDLLLQDKLHLTVPKATFEYHDPLYQVHLQNHGAIRIYETKLVLITNNGPCVILPLSLFKQITFTDFAITLETDSGETLQLGKLGRMFDPFRVSLTAAQNELSQHITQWLSVLLPQTDSLSLAKLSQLLPEGKAARISEILRMDSRFESALQNQINAANLVAEFSFLHESAVQDQIYVGYKRGLWGDLTGDYLWFLFPLADTVTCQPINIMVMETLSTEGEHHRATYFFKILDSLAFTALSPSQLTDALKQAVSRMNRSLLSINFRREPIYLDETKLRTSEYAKYYFAVRQIPALRHLRQLYIGRVIHHTPQQWESDVQKLLQESVYH